MNNRDRFERLCVGPVQRFDQRDEVFRRARYDPKVMRWRAMFDAAVPDPQKAGHTKEDLALTDASWHLEDRYARGQVGSNVEGLYAWASPNKTVPDIQGDLSDPATASDIIKSAARFLGASLVGICELNKLWVYSHVSNDISGEHSPLEIPEDYRYAIAMAIEMDYSYIQTSPAGGAAAATGLAYSKMAFVSGLLAEFIRNLGFNAIPSGNDTALSIPIAIEAGLGELGRNGLLITEKFGPRVRLCKVFTNLPLLPDEPRFLGVEEFCRVCMKCAEDCPSRAISFGDRTTEGKTVSNNPGVLKWYIDPEQCFKWWGVNGMDCSNCIRVCPFNQQDGWHHDLVRSIIRRTSSLNRLFLWFDGVLGYGRQSDPKAVWDHQK